MKPQADPRTGVAARQGVPGWLDGCLAGDPTAVSAMFEENCEAVERIISRLVGATPDLEDLVQNTFIEALQALRRYRGDASFKTWITSIAVHIAQHHLRAGKLRRHAPLELVAEEHVASGPVDVEGVLDQRRMSARLHGLLDRIPANQRIALLLFAIEGRPVEEVAALMGASQTTTRSRVFFARRALRKLIAVDPALSEMAATLVDAGERREEGTS